MAGPIPLFLLRTVLFPHMPMSLHVFEPRYREMLDDCRDNGTTFGVVAIKEGTEVGGLATPQAVGTLAKIRRLQRLDDGRVNLLVTGASRFRVVDRVEGKPYAQAHVEYLTEEHDDVPPALRRRLVATFLDYVGEVQRRSRTRAVGRRLPDEAEVLGYLVAATIDTGLETRQQLLEAHGCVERMQRELSILRFERDLLRRRVLPGEIVPETFSSN
jgi:Lon protease-like protein